MPFSNSVQEFLFGFLCSYFIDVRFKMIKNPVFVMFVNDSLNSFSIASFSFFAIKIFRLIYAILNAAARNVIVDLLDDVSKDPIQMSFDSEKYKRMSSSSMVRRRVRKSAERARIWSILRFGSISLSSSMILAMVFSLVFGVGECNNDPSRHRRQVTINHRALRSVDSFDANGVRRGAATMGGSIEFTIMFDCELGESFKLLTEDRKERGEGTCGRGGRENIVKINVTDDMPIGNLLVKKNETISNAFDSLIHYVLVNRPLNVKECNGNEVYAKVADGTKCTTLHDNWCYEHYDRSYKVGCRVADDNDKWKTWCYGVEDIAKMPHAETDKTVDGCQRDKHAPPYVAYVNNVPIPNDGWINMTKGKPISLHSAAAEFEYKIDCFDGRDPAKDNLTIAPRARSVDIDVPEAFFSEPFKATLEINVTINDQKFYTRHDLFYVETDMKVTISATCNMKSRTCIYEATGELAEFCKQRASTMVCGIKIEQFSEDNKMAVVVPPNALFFWGWYTWDGQSFVHGITAEMTPHLIMETETTLDGGGMSTVGRGGGSSFTTAYIDLTSSTRVTTVDGKQTKSSGCIRGKRNWAIALIIGIGAIIFGHRFT